MTDWRVGKSNPACLLFGELTDWSDGPDPL